MNSTATWQVVVASAEQQFTRIAELSNSPVNFPKEAQYALQIILGSEYLQKCTTESIRNAVINVASVGLTLNPAMKLAYLVPRDGKCCLDISYVGLIKIATDSGSILVAKAEIVRANDQFEYNGLFALPTHKFNPFHTDEVRGDIVGVYSVAKIAGGGVVVDTINRAEITKIRNVSKAKSGPWVTWFEEMIKKSVLKRASKTWPRTERLAAAEAILNEHEGNEIDITPTGEVPALPHRPARQNAAVIASAGQDVTTSDEKTAFLAKLDADTRAKGLAHYEATYPSLSKQQRQWLGKDGHERMWALGVQIDEQRGLDALAA